MVGCQKKLVDKFSLLERLVRNRLIGHILLSLLMSLLINLFLHGRIVERLVEAVVWAIGGIGAVGTITGSTTITSIARAKTTRSGIIQLLSHAKLCLFEHLFLVLSVDAVLLELLLLNLLLHLNALLCPTSLAWKLNQLFLIAYLKLMLGWVALKKNVFLIWASDDLHVHLLCLLLCFNVEVHTLTAPGIIVKIKGHIQQRVKRKLRHFLDLLCCQEEIMLILTSKA